MTKPVEGAVRGRPALHPDEHRRKVLLSLSAEVDLALSVLAETRGTSRSGVVEELVRKALPAPPPPIKGANDNWFVYVGDDGKRRHERARRHSNGHPSNHESRGDTEWAYGDSKFQADLQLDQKLGGKRRATR